MRRDKPTLFLVLAIVQVLSLATIWSTATDLFMSQLAFVIAGFIILLIFSRSSSSVFLALDKPLYITSVMLLLFTAVFGRSIRGSVRWIDLGFFNLQTSEIIKPLLAISYSSYLAKSKQLSWKKLLFFLGLSSVPIFLVARQPDLGSAITISTLSVILLLASGQAKKLLLLGGIAMTIILPLESKLLKPYQRQRLETFINPYKDPKGAGYNVIQSIIAVGSGQIFGKGIKLGTQSHLNFLPERHTDFIFASFTEEFGLVGSLALIVAYYVIFSLCLKSMRQLHDSGQIFLSLSVFTITLFQFVVNIGMNIGILPVTGITLPFFSYGGSSLISFSILMGLLSSQLDLRTPFEL